MLRPLLVGLAWLAFATVALAQDVRVAPLRSLDFELGNVTGLRITAPNAKKGELLKLPKIDGLRIVASGPNSSSVRQVINGRVSESSSLSWELSIRPERVGEFVIPKLPLRIDGQLVRTPQSFRIRVRENTFAKGRAFVELEFEPRRPFLHQSVEVRVRFGIENERSLVQGISDPGWNVAVPIRIGGPWLSEFPAGLVAEGEIARQSQQCVLEDRRVPVRQLGSVERGEREFVGFELTRRYYLNKIGRFELAPVMMQFYWSDPRQRPDILGRRRDTRTGNVSSEGGFVLEVRDLPTDGRPAGFRNAVGTFAIGARLDKRSFDVGENIELRLELLGAGNLDFVELPRLDDLRGFNLFGSDIERQSDKVICRYQLVALSDDVEELPAIELPYFDPDKERYDVARSEPIPIEVTPLVGGRGLEPLPSQRQALVPGVDDIFDRMAIVGPAPVPFRPNAALLWAALLGPWGLFGLGLGFVLWRRALSSDPARLRRAAAAQRFASRLQVDGPLRSLSGYLADRLDCEEGAILHKELAARLAEQGVGAELARETAELVEELAASRYGGTRDEALDVELVQSLVERFEKEGA